MGGSMFGFLIKKWFFDFWDNMIRVVLINLGFVLMMGIVVYLPYLLRFSTVVSFIGGAIGVVIFTIYMGAASLMARDIADYDATGFKEFWGYVKEVWKSTLAFSAVTILELILFTVAFPFYLSMGGFLGLGAVAIIFWISIAWILASQYYFPIRARLDTNIKKIFKKSFIVFFDNTLFSIGLLICSVIILGISLFTAFLLPGITSILLWHQAAFKLRLKKYDYLEENPDVKRNQIPWDALLIEEKEKVGPRTLKGMIFPWKE